MPFDPIVEEEGRRAQMSEPKKALTTHPTIEAAITAMQDAIDFKAPTFLPEALAAARVILSAEPSDAEVEEAAKNIYEAFLYNGPDEKPKWVLHGNSLMQDAARNIARDFLKAAYALRLKEMTEKGEW